MRTTIDKAGRLVIPKAIRDELGLTPGLAVEIEARDGVIEIEPAAVEFRLVRREGWTAIEPDRELPTMTDEELRALIERQRR